MMKKLFTNQKAFASIVEVVITAIIFVIASLGIFTAISTLRPQGAQSVERLEAAYQAREFLEDLQSNLDTTSWGTGGNLEVGTHSTTVTKNGTTYTLTWTVSQAQDSGGTPMPDVRKVDLQVDY